MVHVTGIKNSALVWYAGIEDTDQRNPIRAFIAWQWNQ